MCLCKYTHGASSAQLEEPFLCRWKGNAGLLGSFRCQREAASQARSSRYGGESPEMLRRRAPNIPNSRGREINAKKNKILTIKLHFQVVNLKDFFFSGEDTQGKKNNNKRCLLEAARGSTSPALSHPRQGFGAF